MLIAIIGDFLLSSVLAGAKEVPREVVKEILSDTAKQSVNDALERFTKSRKDELWRAFVAAFTKAIRQLRNRARSDDTRAVFKQFEEDANSLFPVGSAAFKRALDALLRADAIGLGSQLSTVLKPYAAGESPELRNQLQQALPRALLAAFAEILKVDQYRGAWIDFQRTTLQTLSHNLTTASGALGADQQRGIGEILERLNGLEDDPAVLARMANLAQETLATLARLDVRAAALEQVVAQAADANREQFDALERELRRVPLYQEYAAGEIAAAVAGIVREHTQLFVGRDDRLAELDDFVNNRPRGSLLITAGPGVGKSALMAGWIDRRRGRGEFTAHHFFSQNNATTRLFVNGLRNLLRQLYIYHGLRDQPLPSDEPTIRDAIQALLRRGAIRNEPLVIVVDGLDEADTAPGLPLDSPLPPGVVVIGTARAEPGEYPEWLDYWPTDAQRWHLGRLLRSAIEQWVRAAGNGLLSPLVDDESFVQELDDTTHGLALYLHHLVEELLESARKGANPPAIRALLDRAPEGFSKYVDRQWEGLARTLFGQHALQGLIALLAVAHGPLSTRDLEVLSGLTATDLLGLPWQFTRWLSANRQADAYVLGHPLLAAEFERSIGGQAARARNALLAYCANWAQHSSPYALRYYAEHLADLSTYDQSRWEATARDELFALARNDPFSLKQSDVIRDDPYVHLDTLRTAIRVAADNAEKYAAELAGFVLAHAQECAGLTQLSPLEAVRAGGTGSLERAWRLADLHPPEARVLWYLLLAWELHDSARVGDALRTLDRVVVGRLPTLADKQSADAAYLLAHAFDVSESHFATVSERVLGRWDKGLVCAYMAERGHLATAFTYVCQLLPESDDQVSALRLMAFGLVQAERLEETEQVLERIPPAAKRRGEVQQSIASAWTTRALRLMGTGASMEALERALGMAQSIDQPEWRAPALVQVALAEARVGEVGRARVNLIASRNGLEDDDLLRSVAATQAHLGWSHDALDTARQIGSAHIQAVALADTARSLSRSTAVEVLTEVHAAATAIAPGIGRVLVLAALGELEAHAIDAEQARRTFAAAVAAAHELTERRQRVRTLREIGLAQARAGQVTAARETFSAAREAAQLIDNPDQLSLYERNHALGEPVASVAVAQATAGLHQEAIQTLGLLAGSQEKDCALRDIAVAQIRRGEVDLARMTARQIESPRESDLATRLLAALEADPQSLAEQARAIREARVATTEFAYILSPAMPEPVSEAAHRYENSGDAQLARQTIAASLKLGPADEARLRCNALVKLARAHADADDRAVVETILADVRKATGNLSAWWLDDILIETARIRVQLDDFEAALATIGEMHDDFHQTLGLWSLVEVAANIAATRAGPGGVDAVAMLAKARAIMDQIDRPDPEDKLRTLVAIAVAQTKIGNANAAQATFAEADALARAGDATRMGLRLSGLARAYADIGSFADAHKTALDIESLDLRGLVLRGIVRATAVAAEEYVRQSHPDGAAQVLSTGRRIAEDDIADPGQRVTALLELAGAYATADMQLDAAACLVAAQEHLSQVKTKRETLEALQAVAFVQCRLHLDVSATLADARALGPAGLVDVLVAIASSQGETHDPRAAATFLEARRTARQIADSRERAAAMGAIAVAQARVGLAAEAVETARRIETNRSEQLGPIVEAVATSVDQAQLLAMAIPCAYDLEVAYRFCEVLGMAYPTQTLPIARALVGAQL